MKKSRFTEEQIIDILKHALAFPTVAVAEAVAKKVSPSFAAMRSTGPVSCNTIGTLPWCDASMTFIVSTFCD